MWFYADGTGPLVISGNITAVNSASSRTLTIQGSSTAQNTISGIIANGTSGGTIAVTKDGTGTWALTGNNTFSGAVTVNRGLLLLGGQNYSSTANWSMNQFSDCASTIKIIADNPLPYPSHGTAAVVMNGTVAGVQITTLDLNGHWVNCNSLNMGNTSSDVNCVLDNASSSAATLEMTCTAGKTWYGVVKNTGGGDLTVIHRANQNFTIMNHCPNWTGGGLVLTNGCGTFWCDYYDELPNPSSPRVVVTLANAPTGCFRDNQHGSISFTANQQFYIGANNGAIKSGYANGNVVTIAGKITGPGKLIVQGDGKTTAEVLISNTANDWAGGLDIGNNGGTGAILALGNSGVIPHGSSAGNVTLYGGNSGKLDLNGNNATINGLTTSGTAANTAIDNSAASTASVLSVGDNNATGFTFGGIIKNTGSGATLGLTKIGSGTLTLTGANTYSGTTTISSGTLAIGSGGAVGSGTVAVGAGAAFDVSAVGVTLGGSQTLQAGGTGGSSSAIATASGKNLTLGATSPLQFTAYDGSTVPLTVTGAGSLGIATANAVTVTPTTQLAAGSYKLVQIGIGNTTAVSLTGSAPSVTISPPGMVTGGTASLRVTSGELWLDICVHSADPTSASASPSTINTGGSSTLTLSGGGGGTSQTIQWYTGSCGGTAVGSGNSLSVSPTATTTYYGRYEDGAPCSYNSACASATVTVVSLSPVTITNINTSSINYTGGSGSQFVLLGTNNVTAPLTNWTRLYTNPATPGSFTITPSNPEFYRIKSE
jgi:autotransporter-associated beta strand protein